MSVFQNRVFTVVALVAPSSSRLPWSRHERQFNSARRFTFSASFSDDARLSLKRASLPNEKGRPITDMDFNSNDEFLKKFPPNFGPKLKGINRLGQPSDVQAYRHPPKNRQRVDIEKDVEVQRENEMVFGNGNCDPSVIKILSLKAFAAKEFVAEEFGYTQVYGAPSGAETILQKEKHYEIPAEDVVTADAIKDRILAVYNADLSEAVKSTLTEATDAPTMNAEMFERPTLKGAVEGTQIYAEQKMSAADIDTTEVDIINTKDFMYVQYGQATAIEVVESNVCTAVRLCQTELARKSLADLIETSEKADAVGQIDSKEPVTLEINKNSNLATFEIQTCRNNVRGHTQISCEVTGTEDPVMAIEVTKETTTGAKAIYQHEKEPYIPVNNIESVSNSISGFDNNQGICSDADVDGIVDSIMNDIANIEADIEVDNDKAKSVDAGLEDATTSNTKHQKKSTHGKSIALECKATSENQIRPVL